MSLSYATVSIYCGSHGNMLLKSPRETLWGADWLIVPAVASGSTTALEQSSSGCSQSVTSTVWVILHTIPAQHSARQLWLGLVELFTELHCCLRLFPLHPSILFLLCVASLLLVIVPRSFTGVSPNTSVGICFSGPALTQYIRHNQCLISDLSGSDNPDPSEARANLPEKFIWN